MSRISNIFLAIFLFGCSENVEGEKVWTEEVNTKDLKGIEDCKFIKIQYANRGYIYQTIKVIRCPNSSVKTAWEERQNKQTIQKSLDVIEDSREVKD